MKQTVRAVISDLDGSLLNSKKEISPRDLETIRRLKAHGIPFFICTGRHYDSCRHYANLVGLETPMICCHGACLYDLRKKEMVYADCLDVETVRRLAKHFEQVSLPEYYIYTRDTVYYGPKGAPLPYWLEPRDYFTEDEQPHAAPVDGSFLAGRDDVLKYMVFNVGDAGLAAAKEAVGDCASDMYIFHADPWYTEVIRQGEDKGAGVCRAAALYGFDPAEALAIGDQWNDLPMLRTVGFPVVPANANEDAKLLARYICRSNDDSPLTDAIAHFCPEYLE